MKRARRKTSVGEGSFSENKMSEELGNRAGSFFVRFFFALTALRSALRKPLFLALLLVLAGLALAIGHARKISTGGEEPLACVERGLFKRVLRRTGTLQPVSEQHIICQMWGTIQEVVPAGKAVQKGEIVLKIDATAHEDAKAAQEANIAQIKVEFIKQQEDAAKALNQARLDLYCNTQTVELERRRLEELKKGPLPADVINANTNLENAQILRKASADQLCSLEILLAHGYASQEEYRMQKLSVDQQELLVAQADIARRQLYVPDPVKLGDQELKVENALATCAAAKERLIMLEKNLLREREKHEVRMQRETKHLEDINAKIEKTIYRAPAAGTAIYKKLRWYFPAPGRDVGDGWEVMALPDMSRMKALVGVDEAHIAQLGVGNAAEIKPAGWTGPAFRGRVVKVAENGVDEFETYAFETRDIVGAANRQVFEVEVEIEGQIPFFRPGLRAEVEICLQTLPNVLMVPRTAILKENKTAQVRLYSRGRLERRLVKLVAENELMAVVEGLHEGDNVLAVNSD